ncbi:hypothetical protein AB5I41_18970 [Sphingomonas sp. MMS24-JH45]
MPTWVLVLVAISFGSAVMLGLNAGRATDARFAATQTYRSPSIPPLPDALSREPDYAIRVGAPSPSPFATAPFATLPYAAAEERAPAAFAQPAWTPPSAPMASGSSEAAGTYRFPTEPMPGGRHPASAAMVGVPAMAGPRSSTMPALMRERATAARATAPARSTAPACAPA